MVDIQEGLSKVKPLPKGCVSVLHFFVYSVAQSKFMSLLTTDLDEVSQVTEVDYNDIVHAINEYNLPTVSGRPRRGKVHIPHPTQKIAHYNIELLELTDGIHKEYFAE